MYASVKPDGEILLWCDKRQTLPSGANTASNSQKRNTDNSDAPQSKRANRECNLEELTDVAMRSSPDMMDRFFCGLPNK